MIKKLKQPGPMITNCEISIKDYRVWFKLNNRTRISVLTPLDETDNATIMNGISQGIFGAALASSINIESAVYDITKREVTANIVKIVNSLIFQDEIAKMNRTLEDARKGAKR